MKKNNEETPPRSGLFGIAVAVCGALTGLGMFALLQVGLSAAVTTEAPRDAAPSTGLARETAAVVYAEGVPADAQIVAAAAEAPEPVIDELAARGFESRTIPGPRYFPRAGGEWEGMLVDESLQAACDTTSRCGLGMACVDGACGACVADGECAVGEACVLDHCVPEKNVACRAKLDCHGEELCVLSGYSDDLRGNEAMTAFCRPMDGGDDVEEDTPYEAPAEDRAAEPRPVQVQDLHELLAIEGGLS
ncbi:MAG: hypothetical protein P8R42_08730 [Candidatus Binatia bacterium]|nr:hypothetical protein [Candidatus Binatia bacterium]